MLKKEIKKVVFKVKKVKVNEEEVQGIVYPIFKKDYFKEVPYFDDNVVMLKTLDGRELEIRFKEDIFKQTKISNANIKLKIELAIENLKEIYKKQLKIITLQENIKSMNKEIENLKETSDRRILESVVLSGKIPQEQFLSEIKNEKVRTKYQDMNSYVSVISNGNKITGIRIEQEKEAQKYANEGSYDFLFEEYDGNLFVDDELLEDSKDLKKIIKENMLTLGKSFKINGCILEESDEAEVGDKRTVYVSHIIKVKFKKEREFNQESLDYIKSIIKKFK